MAKVVNKAVFFFQCLHLTCVQAAFELGNRVLAISEKRARKAAGKLARPRVVLCDLFDFASTLQHRSGTLPEKPLSSAGVSGCSFPLEQNLMSDDVAYLCPFGLFGLLFFSLKFLSFFCRFVPPSG